jgi:hypothetical protein
MFESGELAQLLGSEAEADVAEEPAVPVAGTLQIENRL